jgi:sugar/nucleoside kinase (ribokinase family)
MGNLELLSIGDASVDVFITPTESETLCRLDDRDSLICFSYGGKIPVDNIKFSVGGNAANNAVGAVRLGLKAGLVLTLGDDSIGQQIIDKLRKESVDMTYVVQQQATTSNYSTVVSYSGERTIFVYHAPRAYQFPEKLLTPPWAYLTSMGETFAPFYKQVASWFKKNPSTKLGFNPGSYQLRAGREAVSDILALTHILFLNRQEAEGLTGLKDSQGKEKELLAALTKLGVKVSVVTDGENGSFVYDGKKYLKAGILPIDAFERTGAGDAFGVGFLSALIKGKSLEEALLWATLNSASVIGYVGPQRGLLKEKDMPEWLERARSSELRVEEF